MGHPDRTALCAKSSTRRRRRKASAFEAVARVAITTPEKVSRAWCELTDVCRVEMRRVALEGVVVFRENHSEKSHIPSKRKQAQRRTGLVGMASYLSSLSSWTPLARMKCCREHQISPFHQIPRGSLSPAMSKSIWPSPKSSFHPSSTALGDACHTFIPPWGFASRNPRQRLARPTVIPPEDADSDLQV